MYQYLKCQKKGKALIEEAGLNGLTISFYQYARLGNPQFSKSFVYPLNELDVLGRFMGSEGITPKIVPSCRKFPKP